MLHTTIGAYLDLAIRQDLPPSALGTLLRLITDGHWDSTTHKIIAITPTATNWHTGRKGLLADLQVLAKKNLIDLDAVCGVHEARYSTTLRLLSSSEVRALTAQVDANETIADNEISLA